MLCIGCKGVGRTLHKRPAVKFAILMLGMAAQGAIILPRNPAAILDLLPGPEDHLEHELARMCLRFLGIED